MDNEMTSRIDNSAVFAAFIVQALNLLNSDIVLYLETYVESRNTILERPSIFFNPSIFITPRSTSGLYFDPGPTLKSKFLSNFKHQ